MNPRDAVHRDLKLVPDGARMTKLIPLGGATCGDYDN